MATERTKRQWYRNWVLTIRALLRDHQQRRIVNMAIDVFSTVVVVWSWRTYERTNENEKKKESEPNLSATTHFQNRSSAGELWMCVRVEAHVCRLEWAGAGQHKRRRFTRSTSERVNTNHFGYDKWHTPIPKNHIISQSGGRNECSICANAWNGARNWELFFLLFSSSLFHSRLVYLCGMCLCVRYLRPVPSEM